MVDIVTRRTVRATPRGYQSADIQLAEKADNIVLRVARPTVANPRAWNGDKLFARIIAEINGERYACSGSASGGQKTHFLTGDEIEWYELHYQLPWGFLGQEDRPRRIGEGKLNRRVWVELEPESPTDLEIMASFGVSDAPSRERFHRSVSFDAATDAFESSGDGTLTLSHTSTGTDRGVLATGIALDSVPPALDHMTYNSSAMTEQWDDTTFGAVCQMCGHTAVAQPTGSQTVSNGYVSAPINQWLGVVSMTGVDQTTPVGTYVTDSDTDSSAEVTVTGLDSDGMIIDCMVYDYDGGYTVGADQTVRNTEDSGFSSDYANSSQASSADSSSGVMSWTFGGSSGFAIGWTLYAIEFKAAAAGGETGSVAAEVDADASFSAQAAAQDALTATADAGATFSALAQAVATVTAAVDAGDGDTAIKSALGAVSAGADAGAVMQAVAQAADAISAGIDAGETWAAQAAAQGVFAAAVDLAAVFTGGTAGSETGALTAGTESSASFVAAAAALALLQAGADANAAFSAGAITQDALSAGVDAGAVFSSLGGNTGTVSAGAEQDAVFAALASALDGLSAAVDISAAFSALAVTIGTISAAVSMGATFSASASTDISIVHATATVQEIQGKSAQVREILGDTATVSEISGRSATLN